MKSPQLQETNRVALATPWQSMYRNVSELLVHMCHRWPLYLPILAIWVLAFIRTFVDPTPRLPVLFNWTDSLPYHVAVVWHGTHAPQRGDYVVFSFAGEAQHAYPGLRGQPFFKQVRGLPGDVITVEGRVVSINGEAMGYVKAHTFDRRPLEPIPAMVIPHGHYFVQGTGADSFDSRYLASGLVRADQVLARVLPLF